MKIITNKEDNLKWFDCDFEGYEGIKVELEFCPDSTLTWAGVLDNIHDWEGIEDDKGKVLKCNRKNKLNFSQCDDGKLIMMWCLSRIQSLNGFLDADILKKKLTSGLSGNGTSQKLVEVPA